MPGSDLHKHLSEGDMKKAEAVYNEAVQKDIKLTGMTIFCHKCWNLHERFDKTLCELLKNAQGQD